MDGQDKPVRSAAHAGAGQALFVFAVIAVIFFFRAAPLSLDPVRTTSTPGQFDVTRSLDRLGRVLDGTPHPVDSAALDAVRSRLLEEIVRLGYEPRVHASNTCRGSISGSMIRCALVQNVFFRAGPEKGPALVLAAHYDSVEASPGFADDGVGLAVWLEVAHLMRERPPSRPVLFLLTDGEETALLGAQAFVNARQDYGVEVGRIINLEARGVRGPAMMFETGHPNEPLVSDWAENGARPFSNSMMTSVYELLPNSTDLTVHLRAGSTGINIAIADGAEFYHTQHDDLEHLDRASVQHMGDQALGAVRAFLASDWGKDATGGEIAYSDVVSRGFVALPESLSLLLLGLCFGVAAMMLVRPRRHGGWRRLDWRAFILPPALVVAGGLSAFLIQSVVSLVRPETAFWTAVPQALNMTIFAGVMLMAGLGLSYLAPRSERSTLYASGWFWFLIVGLGLSLVKPGFSMLFLMPGVVFVAGAAIAWFVPRLELAGYGLASLALALVFFPLIHLLDVMMGLGLAAMFGVLEASVLAPMLALVGASEAGRMRMLAGLTAALAAGLVTSGMAPAYTREHPLALNFSAQYDMDEKRAALFAGARPGSLPAPVRDQLQVGVIPSPIGSPPGLAARALPFTPPRPAGATLVSDTLTSDGRRAISLRLTAPDARLIRLRIPEEVRPVQLTYGAARIAMRAPQSGYYIVEIVGRAADGALVNLLLDPAQERHDRRDWIIQGVWTGLPAEAAATARARPDTAVSIQMGDVTIVTKKQAI